MACPTDDDKYDLVRQPIETEALVRFVRDDLDGAIVTFDGFVRNESHGRKTQYLEYEAYMPMALAETAGDWRTAA